MSPWRKGAVNRVSGNRVCAQVRHVFSFPFQSCPPSFEFLGPGKLIAEAHLPALTRLFRVLAFLPGLSPLPEMPLPISCPHEHPLHNHLNFLTVPCPDPVYPSWVGVGGGAVQGLRLTQDLVSWNLLCDIICKSLQSCLTLWHPIDPSPPGSSVHGTL